MKFLCDADRCIDCNGDVAHLLAPGVSAALAREALRRARLSEPSIRHFIGIAEAQWDFNDPATPGFGPL
jgi:hypothetical protein